MPTVDRFGGYRFFFFSNEGKEPPHVHVEHGGRHAKFWLEPVSLANARGFSTPELMKVRRFVSDRRDKFKEKWNEFFGS
jgi:hypothetical protein